MENSDEIALIIVDVQNDFMEKGSLEVPKAAEILPCINSLRKKFKTIFITQDYHPIKHVSFAPVHNAEPFGIVKTLNGDQWVFPVHCVQGTWGCEFHKDLVRGESDILIQKGTLKDRDSFTGFGTEFEKTGLDEMLKEKGIKKLFIVGICFDICVRDTAVDAVKRGYSTYVIKEGTVALSEKGAQETISLLKRYKIEYISENEIEKYF